MRNTGEWWQKRTGLISEQKIVGKYAWYPGKKIAAFKEVQNNVVQERRVLERQHKLENRRATQEYRTLHSSCLLPSDVLNVVPFLCDGGVILSTPSKYWFNKLKMCAVSRLKKEGKEFSGDYVALVMVFILTIKLLPWKGSRRVLVCWYK